MRGRRATLLAFAVVSLAAPSVARAQAVTSVSGGGARDLVNRTGQSVIDQLDVIWVEDGKLVFSYGNGKLFGIDVRNAMGNPAALRATTDVKWQNFLAEFNSGIVLLAARYPGLLYPEGVKVDEKDVFAGIGQVYSTMALEEQIDLAAYLMQSNVMRGASEDTTLKAFSTLGYIGGTAAGAFLLSTNSVTLPVTFPVDKGEWHGLPYDMRVRIRVDELGFSSTRHPDLAGRFSVRTIAYSEASIDVKWKDAFYGRHFAELDERATYDLRRFGAYALGASQSWNPVRKKYDQTYVVSAAADVIAPGRSIDTRFRTGVDINFKNGSHVPDRYSLDMFRRQSLFHGSRDMTVGVKGSVLIDGISAVRGVGGEVRASVLVGTNVPKYSASYSRADWDRFARVYVIANADTAERAKNTWGGRIVFAAPFEVDRAIEALIDKRFRLPDPIAAQVEPREAKDVP